MYLYDLYDARVEIFYDALGNHIPLGVYYVTEATRKAKILNITGYDGMSRLDDAIGNLTSNGKPFAVLSWICRNCGVELQNTSEEIEGMVNGNTIVNISNNTYSSYRDAVKDVASILGGFATFNRFGKLEIRQYKTTPNGSLTARQRKGQTISEYQTFISEIDATIDSVVYKSMTSQNDGIAYQLSNRMIKGLVSTIQPIVDNILDAIKDLKYTPADFNIVYNPIFDLGDLLTIDADGQILTNSIQTAITAYAYTFNGKSKIGGVGKSIFLARRQKNNSSESSVYNSSNAYSKNNGTYIEVFENIESYSLSSTRKKIVSIDYGNGSADVILLHGQCCVNCTTDGTVRLIYSCDSVDESYSPKQKVHAGYNILDFYCFFKNPQEDWESNYGVDIISTDTTGTIAIGDVKADVMATMYGNGRFLVNNIFSDTIPYYNMGEADNEIAGMEEPDEN